MRKILMLLLTAAMCLTACGKDAPLPEVPVEPEAPPAAAAPEAVPVPAPATPEEPEMVTVWSGWPGVTLSLLQENYPVGVQEITLVLDNRSEMEFDYGEHFSCQKFVDGAWQPVEFQDKVFFHDIAWILEADSVRKLRLNMGCLEQPLDEGFYRLTGEIIYRADSMAELEAWQLDFRVKAEAQPEPDYAMYNFKEACPYCRRMSGDGPAAGVSHQQHRQGRTGAAHPPSGAPE